MPKAMRPEFAAHYERRTLSRQERRAAIRKGYEDFQVHGWSKDPPFDLADVRRWLWQNGAEQAEEVWQGKAGGIEGAAQWA